MEVFKIDTEKDKLYETSVVIQEDIPAFRVTLESEKDGYIKVFYLTNKDLGNTSNGEYSIKIDG